MFLGDAVCDLGILCVLIDARCHLFNAGVGFFNTRRLFASCL